MTNVEICDVVRVLSYTPVIVLSD